MSQSSNAVRSGLDYFPSLGELKMNYREEDFLLKDKKEFSTMVSDSA